MTNRTLNDFVAAARPWWVEVAGDFNVCGVIKTDMRVACGTGPEV